jgi:hypothetical protein
MMAITKVLVDFFPIQEISLQFGVSLEQGCQIVYFAYPKLPIWYIMEGFGMENFGFCGL